MPVNFVGFVRFQMLPENKTYNFFFTFIIYTAMNIFKRKEQPLSIPNWRREQIKRWQEMEKAFYLSLEWKQLENLKGVCQFGEWKTVTIDNRMYIWLKNFDFLIRIYTTYNSPNLAHPGLRFKMVVRHKGETEETQFDSQLFNIEYLARRIEIIIIERLLK